MDETKKSNRVRRTKNELYQRIIKGAVLDIGCGPDPISPKDFPAIVSVTPFDKEHGDANRIASYFPPESFDVVYGSQVLEHLNAPNMILREMLSLCKKGGHVIMSVPHWELYEQGQWPSRWNPDHKWTWDFTKPTSPKAIGVADMLAHIPGARTILIQLCDTNYDYSKLYTGVDQTFKEEDGVEAWIEFVIRREQ